jgi:hypothetical protein
MKKNISPLAIFCCDRIELLEKLLFSLKKNNLSKSTIVYFFLDFSLNAKIRLQILEIINSVNFFKKKIIVKRKKKYGLKKNILNGIDQVFIKYNKIIILEDDLEITSNFLEHMNKLLKFFEKNTNIYTVCGFSFINFNKFSFLKKTNFICSKRPNCWGWATWKKKWEILKKIKDKEYCKSTYGNDLILMNEKKNINSLNSWAFDWTVKHILNNKHCIYPKFSLVKNNGDDKFSTNNFFKTKKKIYNFKNFKINSYKYFQENKDVINEIKNYYDQYFLFFIIKLFLFKTLYIFKKLKIYI